jgi:hypothetical protein
VNVALAELEEFALAQFPEHPIDMDRGKAKRVGEVMLGERAFKAITINCADSLQTSRQLEQQMRGPLQGAASPYIGEMLSPHCAIAYKGINNEGEKIGRPHRSKLESLAGCHQQRKLGSSHERFSYAASIRLRQYDIAGQGKIDNLPLPSLELMGNATPTRLDDVYSIVVVPLIEDHSARWISLRNESQRLDKRRARHR